MRLALVGLLLAACVVPPASASPSAPAVSPTAASPTLAASASPGQLAWRRIDNIPTGRSEVAAAVLSGAVFIVGGFGGPQVAESYSGRWQRHEDYPLPVDHPMAAAIASGAGAGLYVLGGNVNGVATARAHRWSANEGWREVASMPAPRAQAAAVALDGRIYVVGGAASGRLESATFAYDPVANRWSTGAAIPTPRDHLAAAALGGRVCVVGGRRLSLLQNLATFECYDPARDTWAAMPNAPTARGGLGAAAIADRLYVVGGEQPLGTFNEVEIFDLASGRWSRGPDLPTARHGLGVVAVGTTLYVMTGGPTPGGSQTNINEALDIR